LPEYRLELRRSARKEILALQTKIAGQVERTLDRLLASYREGGRPQDVRPLVGLANSYRIDCGEYRILFEVDEGEGIILVFRVRHRRDVYRNL